jgi:hypothetical protein
VFGIHLRRFAHGNEFGSYTVKVRGHARSLHGDRYGINEGGPAYLLLEKQGFTNVIVAITIDATMGHHHNGDGG